MTLYHGTNADILEIDLAQSRIGKDFGVGFYLTNDRRVAERQAQRKFISTGEGKPRVYAYEYDEQEAKSLHVKHFVGYTEDWAEFILSNRHNRSRQQVHAYDIVIGPIADDTVGYQIRRMEEGVINLQQFLEEIKFHTMTIQYMFATKQALLTLHPQ